jgi:hypothetical protein
MMLGRYPRHRDRSTGRIWRVAWPVAGLALTVTGDLHGPPLLLGFGLGALPLWRDRRRRLGGRASFASVPGSEGLHGR